MRLIFILLIVNQIHYVLNARILGIFNSHAYSHYILGETLLEELANQGHQVTMVSVHKLKNSVKNYKHIHIDGLQHIIAPNRHILNKAYKTNYFQHLIDLYNISQTESELMMHHQAFKNLLASNQTFDLVIIDYLGNLFQTGLCHHYKASCILISSVGVSRILQYFTGLYLPWSYIPTVFSSMTNSMTFLERIFNVFGMIAINVLEQFYSIANERILYEKYFPNGPDFDKILRNFSLIFANSHISVETARPVLPIIKQIGGLHVKEPKELPLDLKIFLDDATDGVILFSMGSNLRSAELPPNMLNSFIKVFSKITQKILWKWELDEVPTKLDNVKFFKWLPQNDVLAHPNVKLFITHGGMMSFIETVTHGVPIIGVPMYGDQFSNIATAIYYGYGIRLFVNEINERTLFNAIEDILQNPKYKENVEYGSKLMKDLPQKPLDAAIFWVEYVLRHKRSGFLKTSISEFPFHKIWMIDVWLFYIILIIISVKLVYFIINNNIWFYNKMSNSKIKRN